MPAGVLTLLTWLQPGLQRQLDGGQSWAAWVVAGLVTLGALALATVLLLPLILATIEYWHSTAMTADEYRAADARLVGTQTSRGSDPGTPGAVLPDTEGN